jgi:hypothetical protein
MVRNINYEALLNHVLVGVSPLLEQGALSLANWRPTFRGGIVVSSARVECSFFIRHATSDDETTKLSRNVGHETPSDVAPLARRMGPQLYRCESWTFRTLSFPPPKVGAPLGTLVSNIFYLHSGRKTRDHVSNPYTTPIYRIQTQVHPSWCQQFTSICIKSVTHRANVISLFTPTCCGSNCEQLSGLL